MAAIATPETVAQAAAAITAGGQKVTIERVIQHLGGGSASTVTRLLSAWKEEQRAARAAAPKPEPSPVPPGTELVPTEMLAGVSAALDAVQSVVLATCTALVERERGRADQQLAALKEGHQRQLDQQSADHAAALAELDDELADARDAERLITAELDELSAAYGALEAQQAETAAALATTQQQLAIQAARADGAEAAQGRAEARAEVLHSRIEGLVGDVARLTAELAATAAPAPVVEAPIRVEPAPATRRKGGKAAP
ncbi:MAG: DNA-binding protein [Rhodospirillaceae bacterium]